MEGYIAGGGEDAWTGYLSTARQVLNFFKHERVLRQLFSPVELVLSLL